MSHPTASTDRKLLSRFEPVLRLTDGELFRPSRVDEYVAQAALLAHRPGGTEVIARPGDLTLDRLAELGREHGSDALSLRFVEEPMSAAEMRQWRKQHQPGDFAPTNAAAAAGLIARVVAALMRLSLLIRGRVPGGHTARAHEQTAGGGHSAHYYGRVTRDGGFTALQYWFFYPMNDWRSSFHGVNDHEADWEQITVFVVETPDGPHPAWVAFASHDEKGADLRRRWDDPELEHVGEHPVAHIGAGSHSAACAPGDYLVQVSPDLPAWVTRVRGRLARILPWWDPTASGIGIPFIDYRRGDGIHIGPGQEVTWEGHVIDDDTAWVTGFRGLWGLDTGDPLGGERAPAGPRYERDGTVRGCWRRPVVWAGLDEEAPTLQERERLWRDRPRRLRGERVRAVEELEQARDQLREASLVARTPENASANLLERQTLHKRIRDADSRIAQIDADISALDVTAGPPRAPADPQAHLRQHQLPLHLDQQARSRAVRVWASASAAILFAALGLLMIFGTTSVVAPAIGLVLAMLLVEAAVRRHLVAFVVNLAIAAAVGLALWGLVRLLLDNLRAGIGVLLIVAALLMAAQGLSDAVRRRPSPRDRSPSVPEADSAPASTVSPVPTASTQEVT